MKRLLCFILLLESLLLCACGKEEAGPQTENIQEEARQQGFSMEYQALPGEMALYVSLYADEDAIYVCGMDYEERPLLIGTDGEVELSYGLPEDTAFVHACCGTDDGLAVLAGDRPEKWINPDGIEMLNEQDEYELSILYFNREGALTERISLPQEICIGERIRSLRYVDGYFYLMMPADIYRLDSGGNLLNKLHLEGGSFTAQSTGRAGLYICLYNSAADGGSDTTEVWRLKEPGEFAFETVVSGLEGYVNAFGCDGDSLLVSEDYSLSRYPAGGGAAETVFDLYRAGISRVQFTEIFARGEAMLLAGSYGTNIPCLVPRAEDEKTQLVLWADGTDFSFEYYISSFNQTDPDYELSVFNMQELEDEQVAAMIASGHTPDIYVTGGDGHFKGISPENIMEDIYPYLDEYAPGGRNFVLESVRNSVEIEGKLYTLPSIMELCAVVRNKAMTEGADMKLSQAMMLPEVSSGEAYVFPGYYSRDDIWKFLSGLYMVNHVDTERGQCSFETEEFLDILESCARIPDSPDVTDLDVERQMAATMYLPELIPGVKRVQYLEQVLGENFEIAYDYGTAFMFSGISLGISSASPYKEGAWRFVYHVLSTGVEPGFADFCWPVTKDGLESLYDRVTGKGIFDYEKKEYVPLSQSALETCRELIQHSSHNLAGHLPIQEIMDEEAEKFFAGDRDAAETARIIQSRAGIYLMEQYC